jgi:SulP family sulfate permease
VPDTVIIGFTSAIALVLATFSLKDFLGLPIEKIGHDYIKVIFNLVTHLPLLQWPDAIVGIMTLTIVAWAKGKIKWLPSPIMGIIAGTLLSIILIQAGFPIMTIGSQFQYDLNGVVYQGLPPYPPIFQMPTFNAGSLLTIPSWEELKIMFWPALVIATLAALESLLCATIADNLTQTEHHPNAELRGIGMANILTGMASGIPATAAIARTATNIQNGAKSPIAGIFHAVFVLLYVLLFARFMSAIPMSALAALLIITAFYMSHLKQFQNILYAAAVWDKMTLVVTFTLTVLMDMVIGISVGMTLTMFSYIFQKMGFQKSSSYDI